MGRLVVLVFLLPLTAMAQEQRAPGTPPDAGLPGTVGGELSPGASGAAATDAGPQLAVAPDAGTPAAHADAKRPEKRPHPDYEGRDPEPTATRDALLLVPRVLLLPLYLVAEYVVAEPVGALAISAERNQWPKASHDALTFGPNQEGGIFPTFLIDFGLRPSIGVHLFWGFLPVHNRLSLDTAWGGAQWWTVALADRQEFGRDESLVVPPLEKQAGKKRISPQQVHEILTHAPPPQDGRYRVKASLLAEGEPLGNWSWAGVTDDDPNDIISHEDRRELRATRLLTAWLNHYDTGDNQTLSMWIPAGEGRGWVRHHMIDWNDSLGFLWAPELDQISRRLGYAYYFDVGIIGREFVSLGMRQEPWDRAHFGPTGETLGYFDDADFVPEEWKSGYPNPAFARLTERDAAWMARILARFTDERIEALLGEARADTPLVRSELSRILKGRRDRILRRWLVRLSSFTDPVLETRDGARWLCMPDRAEEAGMGAPPDPWAAVWSDPGQAVRTTLQQGSGRVCARVPADAPDYVVIDVYSGQNGQGPARVHIRSGRVVGLERLEEQSLPPREAAR